MTLLLYFEYLRGKDIITNYHVNFPHYEINRDTLMDWGNKSISIKNTAFGFDELWIWLDCRDAMSNKVATYFFLQSSKDDMNIFMTSQDNSQNESRLRNNMHLLSSCDRVVWNPETKKYERITSKKRFLPPEMQERLFIRVKEYEKRNYYIFSDYLPTGNTRYIRAPKFYWLYDTTQKIRRQKVDVIDFKSLAKS